MLLEHGKQVERSDVATQPIARPSIQNYIDNRRILDDIYGEALENVAQTARGKRYDNEILIESPTNPFGKKSRASQLAKNSDYNNPEELNW